MNRYKSKSFFTFIAVTLSSLTIHAYNPKAVELYKKGSQSLEQNKIQAAVKLFQNSLKIDKTMHEAYYLLANIYYVQGKTVSAMANYKKALELKPDHINANRYLGNLYLNSGDINQAANHLKKALSLAPSSQDILSEYATALFYQEKINESKQAIKKGYSKGHFGLNYLLYKILSHEDKIKEATTYLEYAHNQNPTEKTTNELSQNYITLKRYDDALEILFSMQKKQDNHFEQIVTILLLQNRIEDSKSFITKNAKDISHDTFFKLKGDIYLLNEEHDDALKAYRKIRKKTVHFDLNEKLGDIYFKKNSYKRAKTYYQKVLKNASTKVNIEKKLIFILYSEGKMDQAFNMANRLLQKLPNDTEALNQIALILLKQKKFPLAKHYFTRSLSINDKQGIAHYYLGIINYNMKLYDLSIVNFDNSLKYDKNNTSTYVYMGNAYEVVNQYDQAYKHFKKALEIEKDNKTALLNLGKAYYNQNELDDSLVYLNKYLELSPKDAKTTFLVAEIYNLKGNFEKAEEFINKAVNISGAKAEFLLKLASIHSKRKDSKKAIDTLRKLLRKEPNNIEANMTLGNIYLTIGDSATALHFFRAVIMKESSNVVARSNLTQIYLSLNNLTNAKYHVKKLKYYQPTAPIIPWAEGVYEFRVGNFTKALDHFTKSTFDPFSTNMYQGKIYLSLSDYEKSLFHLNKAIELQPNSVDAHGFIALVHFLKNEYEPSLEILNKLIRENTTIYPELLYITAEIEFKRKDSTRALSLATTALENKTSIKAHPFSKTYKNKLYLLLGVLYDEINEHAKATQFLTLIKGKAYKDNYVNINLLLANNYYKSMKRKEALNKWNLVLRKAPENPDALLGISKLFSLQKNYNKAISFAKRVVALPTDAQRKETATLMIGEYELMKSRPKKAIEAFENAVKLNPSNVKSYMKLADTKFLIRDYNGTIETLREAIKLDKRDTALRLLLGKSFTNIGDLANAADQFEELIAIDPQNLNAYVSLVDVLIKSQKHKVAQQYINHALKIVGDDANGRNIAKKLNTLKETLLKDSI